MKLGVELLARRAVTLKLGTYFETWIATAAGTVRRSVGRDEYHLPIALQAGRRLAGTGRTHICQVDLEHAELGENQARAAELAVVPASSPLVWSLRTNLFLTLSAFRKGAVGRLLREGEPPLPFQLDDPDLNVTELSPGRYVVDLAGLLKAD